MTSQLANLGCQLGAYRMHTRAVHAFVWSSDLRSVLPLSVAAPMSGTSVTYIISLADYSFRVLSRVCQDRHPVTVRLIIT